MLLTSLYLSSKPLYQTESHSRGQCGWGKWKRPRAASFPCMECLHSSLPVSPPGWSSSMPLGKSGEEGERTKGQKLDRGLGT